MVSVCASGRGEDVLLSVEKTPEDGLVVAQVDLTSAVRWCGIEKIEPTAVKAFAAQQGRSVPFQFVPAPEFHATERIAGTIVADVGAGGDAVLRLEFGAAQPQLTPWEGAVNTAAYSVKHEAEKLGGFPSRIAFAGTEKVFEPAGWQDRTYSPDDGAFRLVDDRKPTVSRLAAGPLCTVVQVSGRYVRPDGVGPPSQPEATYQWFYFHDRPLAYVTAVQRQRTPFVWKEVHFLELHQGDDFPFWAGGAPVKKGEFHGGKETERFSDWACLIDGQNSIAVLRSGQMLIHDGKGGYGPYLHAHGSLAWSEWSGVVRQLAAWLWIGSHEDPVQAVGSAAARLPDRAKITVSTSRVRAQVEAARDALRRQESQPSAAAWSLIAAEQLEAEGRFEEAMAAAKGTLPPNWRTLTAGDLGLLLEELDDGVRVRRLIDSASGVQLMAAPAPPLFLLTLRNGQTNQDVELDAVSGWRSASISTAGATAMEMRWRQPQLEGLSGLAVVVRGEADAANDAIRWKLHVDNADENWIVRRVVFPQAAVADLGDDGAVLFPRGSGEVQRGLWGRSFRYQGRYPSGWTTMQFMAAYDQLRNTGLYVGVHDPQASTKEMLVESRPSERTVAFSFDHPAAEMDTPGNDFQLSGEAVWQIVRGDWFDAAIIYRDWVRSGARWRPALTAEGREDTPRWMRELPVWALASGAPQEVVPQVKRFAELMGAPVGVHWYNWHQIPFDNDYPHYFPAKEGFAAGAAELQKSKIYVMPYINGRLWDTRDRGVEDFEFSSVAAPAATKDEAGQPYIETYRSKESNGEQVRLAVMCPATDVWRDKVSQIVLRLMNECGVKGVYIDQVAAAKPQLCFDRSHGHLAGGGGWWTDAYWRMLSDLRSKTPSGHMLTTECNAEPYVHVFDGYLTWHWQYDGQAPAFPAVYGGAIQMFGRAYRGGPTKDLALRMKAGQQLVFGEQIGWINPAVANEKENAEFLRQIVRLRWLLRRYFYAGQMARPPQVTGKIPQVTADWQWSGEWPVTTSAVMAGAWELPAERRLALLLVNVADEAITVNVAFDAARYGLPPGPLQVSELTADGAGETRTRPTLFQKKVNLPPRKAVAWEVAPGVNKKKQ